MNRRTFLFHTILLLVFAVLQTTLLKRVDIAGVVPDLVFVLLIFSSVYQGSLRAQGSGFLVGLLQDILSLAPPGFNAFICTLSAFICGLFKGTIFFDPVLMPILFTGIGTIFKNILAFILKLIFIDGRPAALFTRELWIEVGLNVLLAPIVFGLLKLFKVVRMNERETG